MKAKIIYRENLTDSLAIFRFDVPVPDFKPGQFSTIGLPHPEKEDKFLWRPYSISSNPEQKEFLELYIRWAKWPVLGKFTTMLWELEVGDEVEYKDPKGAFSIADAFPDGTPDKRRIVLIGGGTGVAPFMSAAASLHAQQSDRQIVLCHGVSYINELGYRDELLKLEEDTNFDFKYLASVSRPDEEANAGWDGLSGRVETIIQPGEDGMSAAERAAGEKFTPENTSFYICGFGGTVDSVKEAVEADGFVTKKAAREDDSFDIRFESYG
jgi:ferredoxin--NADP+ reductase